MTYDREDIERYWDRVLSNLHETEDPVMQAARAIELMRLMEQVMLRLRDVRNVGIARQRAAGCSAGEVGGRHGMSKTQVQTVDREVRDKGIRPYVVGGSL